MPQRKEGPKGDGGGLAELRKERAKKMKSDLATQETTQSKKPDFPTEEAFLVELNKQIKLNEGALVQPQSTITDVICLGKYLKTTWDQTMNSAVDVCKGRERWQNVDSSQRDLLRGLPDQWRGICATCEDEWDPTLPMSEYLNSTLARMNKVMSAITRWHMALGSIPDENPEDWLESTKALADLKIALFQEFFGLPVMNTSPPSVRVFNRKHSEAISCERIPWAECLVQFPEAMVTGMVHFKAALVDLRDHLSNTPEFFEGRTYIEAFLSHLAVHNFTLAQAREAFVEVWGDDLRLLVTKRCSGLSGNIGLDEMASDMTMADHIVSVILALHVDKDDTVCADFCADIQKIFEDNVGDVVALRKDLLAKMKQRKTGNKGDTEREEHMGADAKLAIMRIFLRVCARNNELPPQEFTDFVVDVLLTKVKRFKEATKLKDLKKKLLNLMGFTRAAPQEITLAVARHLLAKDPDLLLPEPDESKFAKGGQFSRNYKSNFKGAEVFVKVISLSTRADKEHSVSFFLELVFLFRHKFQEYLGEINEKDHFHRGLGLYIQESAAQGDLKKRENSLLCVAIPLETDVVPLSHLTVRETADVMVQIAKDIHLYHTLGWVHKDLHPGNFIVKRDSEGKITARLCDHGLTQPVMPLSKGNIMLLALKHIWAESAPFKKTTPFECDYRMLGAAFMIMALGVHINTNITIENQKYFPLGELKIFAMDGDPFKTSKKVYLWPKELLEAIKQLRQWEENPLNVEGRGVDAVLPIIELLETALGKVSGEHSNKQVFEEELNPPPEPSQPPKESPPESDKDSLQKSCEQEEISSSYGVGDWAFGGAESSIGPYGSKDGNKLYTSFQSQYAGLAFYNKSYESQFAGLSYISTNTQTRGLEFTGAVTLLTHDGRSFEVECDNSGVDPTLLCDMFGTEWAFLCDAHTGVFTPLRNARMGGTYRVHGTPVFDLSASSTQTEQPAPKQPAAPKVKVRVRKAAVKKTVLAPGSATRKNATAPPQPTMAASAAPPDAAAEGSPSSDRWRTESAMVMVEDALADDVGGLMTLVCRWDCIRSSGQVGQAQKFIKALEGVGICTVDDLRAHPEGLAQSGLPIGLKNYLLDSVK